MTPKFLDTTLRDGEQTPGIVLKVEDKVEIAKAIDKLCVDFMEIGSAIASEGEREAIKSISNEKKKGNIHAQLLSFARIKKEDINYALNCGVDGIFLVAPTSDIHIKDKLNTTRENVKNAIIECVEFCKGNDLVVDLCCEDGTRTDINFLKEILKIAIELKVDRFTVADTIGTATIEKIAEIFRELKGVARDKISLGVHCHDDFGMATINTVVAVRNGADVVDVTVNGLGERAGNAAIEEVATALKFLYNYDVNINFKEILKVSKFVEKITGIGVARNKAIVGENAFTHGAGIHVDGILKNPATYEAINPEIFGAERKFVLGKLMGRKTVQNVLKEMNINVNEKQFKEIFEKLQFMADKGTRLTNFDVRQVANNVLNLSEKRSIILDELVAVSGNKFTPFASLKLMIDKKEIRSAGVGNGPVDAAINAIKNAAKDIPFEFLEYHVDAISGGSDAGVQVEIKLRSKGKTISARGIGTDIVLASVEAFLNGLNLIVE